MKRRRCLVIISAVTAVRRNSYQKYRICLSSTKRGGSRSRPAPFKKCCRSLQALPCGDRAGCIVHVGARCTRRGTACSLVLPLCAVCSYTRTIGHGASVSSCTARLYHRARRVQMPRAECGEMLFLVVLSLHGEHFPIYPVVGLHQLIMRSVFGDGTVCKNGYLIRKACGGKAMRNIYCGLTRDKLSRTF